MYTISDKISFVKKCPQQLSIKSFHKKCHKKCPLNLSTKSVHKKNQKSKKGFKKITFQGGKGGRVKANLESASGRSQGCIKRVSSVSWITRQIDPRKTASNQKIAKSSWAKGPVCNKKDTRHKTQDIRP